jgi:hypothetical protein
MSLDGNEPGADAAALHEHHVIGAHRGPGRHGVDGNMRLAKARPQKFRHDPRRGASADDEKIEIGRVGKYLRESRIRQLRRRRDRPSPDAIRQAQQ